MVAVPLIQIVLGAVLLVAGILLVVLPESVIKPRPPERLPFVRKLGAAIAALSVVIVVIGGIQLGIAASYGG